MEREQYIMRISKKIKKLQADSKLMLLYAIIIIIELIIFSILGMINISKSPYIKDIPLDSPLLLDLYNTASPSNSPILLDELYKNNKFNDNYIIALGIINYLKENNQENVTYINNSDLKNNIKYIFGNITYKDQDTYIMYKDYCKFNYDEKLARYESIKGCDDGFTDYYRKLDSAYTMNNKLFIKEKIIYYTSDLNEAINKVSIFTNPDMLNILDYREIPANNQIDYLADFIDKGSIYLYEFAKIDNNNNYYFKSIQRVS